MITPQASMSTATMKEEILDVKSYLFLLQQIEINI